MIIRDVMTVIFLSLGFICFFITTVGVFRLKDFYARLHAAGICESAGLVLCSIGFLIYEGFSATGLKIFAVFMAVFIASPIGTHIIIRVAFKQSMRERENAGSAAAGSDENAGSAAGSPAGEAEKEVP